MKILLSADTHGKKISIDENIDIILVAGDFAKGDKLRKAVFAGGSIEEAKQEIHDSSIEFIRYLASKSVPVVFSMGNAEEVIKDEIADIIKQEKGHYIKNGILEIKGLKIFCIDFFVEEWWTDKYKPGNLNTKQRAIRDEKELQKAIRVIKNKKVDIVLSHLPPYGVLDIDPDPPDYLKDKKGHMGSKILREYIKKYQPKLVVCGHIHIPGQTKIGNTIVINPGEKKVIEF